MSLRFLGVTFLTVILLGGCGGNGENIAKLNGKNISKAEFESFLKIKRVPADNDKKRERLLDQYLEREALATVIEQQELLDKQMIQVELNEFRKEMLISRYFEKFLKDKVSDQAVRNYYNTNGAEYEQKKAHAAHILIRINKRMSEPERQAKLTTAQDAYSQVKSGKEFAEIAKRYSEDRISAEKGGDLGWIKEGSIDKRFSKTIFEGLKEGEVSEPFETPFGFHIVKILEAPQVVKQPFEAVSGDIRYQLRSQAKKAELERLKAEIEIEKL
ncbi:MAG: peptidylprolyl isomerase [Desulfurivibrionaceae bacterium]